MNEEEKQFIKDKCADISILTKGFISAIKSTSEEFNRTSQQEELLDTMSYIQSRSKQIYDSVK